MPLVSWIEVTMLNSEHKAKSFLKGLAYSFAGFVVFAIIASNFHPSMKLKESALPEVRPVVAVVPVPVSEDVKPEPKVSTDAEIAEAQAAYMAELRERERQLKEWEAEQEREQREQEAEKKNVRFRNI